MSNQPVTEFMREILCQTKQEMTPTAWNSLLADLGVSKLTREDINFLLEVLQYGERQYEEKAGKYQDTDGYYEIRRQKMEQFNAVRSKLQEMK